jgi:protein-tyrosine phosphatase
MIQRQNQGFQNTHIIILHKIKMNPLEMKEILAILKEEVGKVKSTECKF